MDTQFPVHSVETAPEAAQQPMRDAVAAFGFLPNLLAKMAEAPALLKAYLALTKLFDETPLTPIERQIVYITASRENACGYCIAAHTTIAAGLKAPASELDACRAGQPLADPRLRALQRYAAALVKARGQIAPSELDAFLAAGYTPAHALSVVVGLANKTLSNFADHIAHTPLDEVFAAHRWTAA